MLHTVGIWVCVHVHVPSLTHELTSFCQNETVVDMCTSKCPFVHVQQTVFVWLCVVVNSCEYVCVCVCLYLCKSVCVLLSLSLSLSLSHAQPTAMDCYIIYGPPTKIKNADGVVASRYHNPGIVIHVVRSNWITMILQNRLVSQRLCLRSLFLCFDILNH